MRIKLTGLALALLLSVSAYGQTISGNVTMNGTFSIVSYTHYVDLTWMAGVGGGLPTGYHIYRADVTGGPYLLIDSTSLVPGYRDLHVTHGSTYFYVVTAFNVTHESAYSNEASATIP